MTYKTIIVHCSASPKVVHRLAVAIDLAQRHTAHLVGVYVNEPFVTPAMFEGTAALGDLLAAHEQTARTDLAAAKTAFFKAAKGTHVSAEWRSENGYVANQLGIHARYADLLVLGQSDPDSGDGTPTDLPEALTLSTGRPTLVVPHIGAKAPVGKTVMLCWNASRESARAAADALPLLRGADKVIVLSIDPKPTLGGHGAEPGADVATWLARHGVNVTVQRDLAGDSDVGGVILSRASDHDVDLIVMGLYGHSRLREMVLGGASRTLLASMTVPVFMAH